MMNQLALSRIQQIWVIVALAIVCIPIWFRLPFWVGLIGVGCLIWRSYILVNDKPVPSKWVSASMGIVVCMGIVLQYMPPIGVDPMSALLTMTCALKLLEMRRIREVRMILNLALFVASIQLIFEQGIGNFIIALTGVIFTLAAMNITQKDPWRQYALFSLSAAPLKSAGKMALFAVPLSLFIFVITPRLPSLWVIPLNEDEGRTGVSDSMSAGSIGSLTRSDELAFRVTFEDQVPAKSQLYWRGLVLSDFDGDTWSRGRGDYLGVQDGAPTFWPGRPNNRTYWRSDIGYTGNKLTYDVFMEPSGRPWLFAIAAPTSADSNIGRTRSFRLIRKQPVSQRTRYRVTSYPEFTQGNQLIDPAERRRNLRLPVNSNPQTQELGRSWAIEGLQPEEMLQRLYSDFNQNFVYTLEPGAYGQNSIDEFLFSRRQGFCEHFSEAAVFALRAAGVPARIVVGYQGGEVHPDDGYLLVHQYDAHAWGEYWHPDGGWRRIDPTAAVAPERIELGARDLFQNEPDFLADELISLNRFSKLAMFDWLRLRLDSLDYLWLSWVLGYDAEKQQGLFGKLFGGLNYKTMLIACGIVAILMLGLTLFIGWWRDPLRKTPIEVRLYKQFCARLERLGWTIKPSLTPRLIADMARASGHPKQNEIIEAAQLFERCLYSGSGSTQALRHAIRQC